MVWHAVPQKTEVLVYCQADVVASSKAVPIMIIIAYGRILRPAELPGGGAKTFFTPSQNFDIPVSRNKNFCRNSIDNE